MNRHRYSSSHESDEMNMLGFHWHWGEQLHIAYTKPVNQWKTCFLKKFLIKSQAATCILQECKTGTRSTCDQKFHYRLCFRFALKGFKKAKIFSVF